MKSNEFELAFLYLLFDIIILNASMLFMGWFNLNASSVDICQISVSLLLGNLSCLVTYFIYNKKNLHLNNGFIPQISRISKQSFIFIVVLFAISFLINPELYSWKFLFKYSVLFYMSKLVFYKLLYIYLKTKRQRGIDTQHAIVIYINETSQMLRKNIERNLITGYRFMGFVDDKNTDHPEVIGHPDCLDAIIDEYHIEMVFVTISMFSCEKKFKEFLLICNRKGIPLRFVPENQYLFKSRANMESISNLAMINPQAIPLDNLISRLNKRLFDVLFSIFCILFIFSWLFPIIILLVKLSSKGPVFFVQERTGINNRIFKCLKFRSMKVNAEAHTRQATENDSRITSIGHFLRDTHLDELPQFFNVLLGHMSVVGPRPHMLKHTEVYSKLIQHYMMRHYVKPGISGWAQTKGFNGETGELWKMQKRVEYDMQYIENWTFFWDIKIIWNTLFSEKQVKYINQPKLYTYIAHFRPNQVTEFKS